MADHPSFLERVIDAYSKGDKGTLYSDAWWPHTLETTELISSLLDAQPPATILDLACGSGAATTALALKGFEVTGLDCTPVQIDAARRESAAKGAHVEWLCEDMQEIHYDNEFDFVLLRDVIFGIFETDEEHRDLIRRIARALKPGGRCLFEVYNKEFALAHGVQRTYFYDAAIDRFAEKERRPGAITVKLYTHNEWEEMLSACGLTINKWDGWKGKGDPAPPPWRADYIVAEKTRP